MMDGSPADPKGQNFHMKNIQLLFCEFRSDQRSFTKDNLLVLKVH